MNSRNKHFINQAKSIKFWPAKKHIMMKRFTLLTLLSFLMTLSGYSQDVTDKENVVKNAELENYAGKLKKLGKFYMVEDNLQGS